MAADVAVGFGSWEPMAPSRCTAERTSAGMLLLPLELPTHIAVAVASGTPCLGQYRVAQTGRVLVYAAEGQEHVVRKRLAGICAARGVVFNEALDVIAITEPTVRLDLSTHRENFTDTIETVKPKLVVSTTSPSAYA